MRCSRTAAYVPRQTARNREVVLALLWGGFDAYVPVPPVRARLDAPAAAPVPPVPVPVPVLVPVLVPVPPVLQLLEQVDTEEDELRGLAWNIGNIRWR